MYQHIKKDKGLLCLRLWSMSIPIWKLFGEGMISKNKNVLKGDNNGRNDY